MVFVDDDDDDDDDRVEGSYRLVSGSRDVIWVYIREFCRVGGEVWRRRVGGSDGANVLEFGAGRIRRYFVCATGGIFTGRRL